MKLDTALRNNRKCCPVSWTHMAYLFLIPTSRTPELHTCFQCSSQQAERCTWVAVVHSRSTPGLKYEEHLSYVAWHVTSTWYYGPERVARLNVLKADGIRKCFSLLSESQCIMPSKSQRSQYAVYKLNAVHILQEKNLILSAFSSFLLRKFAAFHTEHGPSSGVNVAWDEPLQSAITRDRHGSTNTSFLKVGMTEKKCKAESGDEKGEEYDSNSVSSH